MTPKAAIRSWKIIEIARRQWVWERANADGTSTRMGPFPTIAACTRDAETAGFDESKLDRRRLPREQNER